MYLILNNHDDHDDQEYPDYHFLDHHDYSTRNTKEIGNFKLETTSIILKKLMSNGYSL